MLCMGERGERVGPVTRVETEGFEGTGKTKMGASDGVSVKDWCPDMLSPARMGEDTHGATTRYSMMMSGRHSRKSVNVIE